MTTTMPISELSTLPIFPFADEFPYISDEEMLELAQDIEENGMHHPIVLFNDQVLDGRNRLRALAKTNLTEAPTELYEGDDPIGYVIALNMLRRHLTAGQRAMLAVSAKEHYKSAGMHSDDTAAAAAEKFGVSRRAVFEAQSILNNAAAEVIAAVKSGEMGLKTAIREIEKKQAASPGAYDGSKAHESEEAKLAEQFENRIKAAYNNFLDAISNYAQYGGSDDIRQVTLLADKIVAVAEKTFSG